MVVHVNAAVSVDGKLSTRHREQIPISGPTDFDRVERLRATCDAVLVGIGTVTADDPSLTVDRPDGSGHPVRVVLDTRARTPSTASVLTGDAPTIIVVGDVAPADRVATLRDAGATVIEAGGDRVDVAAAVAALREREIVDILVEGGGEIVFSMFEAGQVDRLTVYVGSVVIGGRDAPTLVDGVGFDEPDAFPRLALERVDCVDDGVVLSYTVD